MAPLLYMLSSKLNHLIRWEKEKSARLLKDGGFVSGAGAGIELARKTRMNAGYFFRFFNAYHQKYHHLVMCQPL